MPTQGMLRKLETTSAAAGAPLEELKGERRCVLRVSSLESAAWRMFEDSASSGELCHYVQLEATSIISHFSALTRSDVATGGLPALLARVGPQEEVHLPTNVREAIGCPGPTFPTIHAASVGHDIFRSPTHSSGRSSWG